MNVLTALKELDGAGITELADHLGLAKSNVHNYLNTLHQEGYVRKDGTTYHVGLQLLELGAYARQKRPVYDVAKPELRGLAQETGERVNLLVEEHGMGIYLHNEAGSQAVKVDAYAGSRVHLHNTALGKAILAHLSEERVSEILDWHGMPRTTNNTITDRGELFEELADILAEINANGTTMLLVEQNVDLALRLSDYTYLIDEGAIVFEGDSDSVRQNEEVKSRYLSI